MEQKIKEFVEQSTFDLFVKAHEEFNTVSGDITPDQALLLTKIKDDLTKLIVEQVTQNLE